jgi:hypothetical protein
MKFHVRGQPMFHRPEWTLIVDDPCRRSNVAVHDLHPNFDIQFRQTKGHIEPQTKPIGMTLNYIKFLYVFYVLFPMNIWKKIRFSQFQRSSDPTIHRHLGPIQANAIQLLFHLDHWGRRFPKIGAPQKNPSISKSLDHILVRKTMIWVWKTVVTWGSPKTPPKSRWSHCSDWRAAACYSVSRVFCSSCLMVAQLPLWTSRELPIFDAGHFTGRDPFLPRIRKTTPSHDGSLRYFSL